MDLSAVPIVTGENMGVLNFTNITELIPPVAAQQGVGVSYVVVYDFWGSTIFLLCALTCAFCCLYLVAEKVREKWRGL